MATTDAFTMETMAELLKNWKEPQTRSLLLSQGYRDKVETTFPLRSAEYRNPLYSGGLASPYLSMNVRVMDIPKQKVYDWSACRSPSRARRRHAQGIPQRVKITECDVAYIFDERVLTDFTRRWDRSVAKILFDGV